MKKYLIAFLLSLSCVFTIAAVGCEKTEEPSSTESESTETSTPEENEEPEYSGSYAVTFEEGEGFTYKTDVVSGEEVDGGEYVDFEISLGGFYQDSTPLVYVNDKAVAHNGDGKYSVQVTDKPLNIRVTGIKKDVSTLNQTGTGSLESPFVVSKPIDLIYMAEQVNKGEPAYVQGAYILANDIDCNGAELQVIGNGSTEYSYFSGCFSCDYDEEGIPHDYKISNFTINSQGSNYVGLFGQVYADFSVTSSGLFYGIRLDNFTIEAGLYNHSGDNKTICAGGLIGYGVGANLLLCEATNGVVNVTADKNYFSFAGGMIGYQQAYYDANYDQYFPSEIAYATVDVDVTVLGEGMALYAGGIVGYMATNYPLISTASVHNSYATGDVSSALNCGGIVGGLGQYSVVSNCYASGSVFATSYQNANQGTATSDDYYKAHAGGLVGFAENDAIAHDSFFNGEVAATAVSGNGYFFTDTAIGGSYDDGYVSATSKKAQAINCKANVPLNDTKYFTDNLGWGSYDWIFKKDSLPLINYEATSAGITLSMTLHYVAPNKAGENKSVTYREQTSSKLTYFDSQVQSNSSYNTFGAFLAGGDLPYYCATDDGKMRSFGYFFDPECTQPVPYAYMPTKNVDLYIGFEDVSPILGTYYFVSDASTKPLEITFREDGIVRYSDGMTEQEAYYMYDQNGQITIDGARFARYYDGEIVLDETATGTVQDANFDLYRYMYYNFVGKVENGTLSLYDGVYFTESKPLTATTSKPNVIEYDAFAGEWTKTANVNKVYFFDGQGNWSYSYVSYERDGSNYTENTIKTARGTYTLVDNNHITFTDGGVTYNAIINTDGVLEITDSNGGNQKFYRGASYLGKWTANGLTLELLGIQANGTGLATLTYTDGTVVELVYEETETENYLALYYPHADYWKNELFGYFIYNLKTHTLSATMYDANNADTGYSVYTFRSLDEYFGEWITDDGEFAFDGNGLYGYQGRKGYVTVTIGGETKRVEYSLDSTLNGTFTFNSDVYTFSYDEDKNTVSLTSNTTEDLKRKDKLANVAFVDMDGNEYAFDGKSTLAAGGKLTVNGSAEYVYTVNGDGYTIWSGESVVGSLILENNHYALTIDGSVSDLYMSNEFMGDWVMSGLFSTFNIGPTDLNGVIKATFKGKAVEMAYLDTTVLTFNYREGNMPYTYYVFVIDDEAYNSKVLVITEYPNLFGDDQVFCTKANELFGTWVWNKDQKMSIRFDGVSCSYVFGTANMIWGSYVTPYNYRITENGMMMYSQEVLGGDYLYFNLKLLFPGDEGYEAAKADRNSWYNAANESVLIREEADSLCLAEAKDEDRNEYYFDGLGNIFLDGDVAFTYEYKNVTFHGDKTATIKAQGADGKEYSLFLNYQVTDAYTLEIVEEEPTEEEGSENA